MKNSRIFRLSLVAIITVALIIARLLGLFDPLDSSIYARFHGSSNFFIEAFTETASIYFFLAVIVIIAIYQLYKFRGFTVGLLNFVSAFILVSLLTLLIKYVTAIPRPGAPQVVSPSLYALISDVYSFPSGHTSRASTAAYFLSKRNRILLSLSWIYVFLIGISRIVLAVHWFSDVLVGVAVGLFSGELVDLFSPSLLKVYKIILLNEKRIIGEDIEKH